MLNDAVGFEKIFIATGYTDLRRGIDGLASTIKFQFDLDPFQKHVLFLFCGKWSYVKKKYKLNMPFFRLAYPAKASAFSSNAA